ncbi:MAG: CoA pyrophosphatase [Burkholderiales bacterium]|nr:CoA pyrophosphatase [Burkholderiales bacterium]
MDPIARNDSLSAEWLRSRFAAPPAYEPETRGDGLLRGRFEEIRDAAVLVPVVDRRDQLTVLFTRRTAHLHDHAGQISFPGGRSEADESALDTALRETEEEIGLARGHVEPLGELTEYVTITGYRVTPVVALVRPPFDLAPDDFEVAEIFEVPLAFLLDPANHQRNSVVYEGLQRHYYAMPYGPYYIWGATAGMLMNLYRFLGVSR